MLLNMWQWVVLTGKFWERHGAEVESFRHYLPGDFDNPPQNPAKKINSHYKAQEYLTYIFGYLPGLLYNILPLPYWQHFCKLVCGIRIILQRTISTKELEMAHQLLLEYCVEFEVLYVQRKASRLHFVYQSIHNVIHLAPDTSQSGPLSIMSQWTIEHVIGYLGALIQQPSNLYKNLSEQGLRQAQINALLAMTDLCPEITELPHGAIPLGNSYVLKHPQDPKATMMSTAEV
ncbi:hypothetical protein H1R20_g902, partial [Candolleomyces eurysporus]